MNKMDILAFGAHPDDVEIGAGGTVISCVQKGLKVAVVDLTQGQLGSRGSAELRLVEAQNSAQIMGLAARENLGMQDGFFEVDKEHLLQVIEMVRKYRPEIVLCNAPSDRHPDHGRASALVERACFLSGLVKIQTSHHGEQQQAWRPKVVYKYIQDYYLQPDFVYDITGLWEKKIEALKCFSSQFYNGETNEPKTPISGAEYFDFLKGRAMEMGRPAGFLLGEGFITSRAMGIKDFSALV